MHWQQRRSHIAGMVAVYLLSITCRSLGACLKYPNSSSSFVVCGYMHTIRWYGVQFLWSWKGISGPLYLLLSRSEIIIDFFPKGHMKRNE
ncbi:hypothetical protein DFH05DRAFT_669347 [Lentinula detonsa]|uniref:Secreted protein n=1 Tax=Lentinula detonsa TaxID=2804962 RepID=A0A9W8U252_9AGAR|nr:hypothetical protein DFH05DRAFT_669347 [Lentinula detonsa]